MSTFALSGLFRHTPALTVTDSRGLTVRAVAFLRHPDTPDVCDLRVTR
ncbi:TPA: hypothetical protein RFN03_004948, partial [Klebsiella aerogenes]|nr:hypothetical protein [Klebsiella aerogenes]HDU4054162.1 hypothetical protein [Klebsiella aerogenes]HDU4054908.1 hypothetical protein [Klebsiella aerogenes]